MTLHRNARTCPRSRKLLVDRVISDGWSVREAAEAAGISERSVCKWLKRYRDEGEAGLADLRDQHIQPGPRAHLGDARSHEPAANHAHTLNLRHHTVPSGHRSPALGCLRCARCRSFSIASRKNCASSVCPSCSASSAYISYVSHPCSA